MGLSEIIRLNVLEDYDVNWSLEFIVRDFVQNYFDSVVDSSEYNFDSDIHIKIDHSKGFGYIQGPIKFDWENLKYIGATTKNDKSKYAGGFGEGFIIACLCLHKLKPEIKISMVIGDVELRPFVDSTGKRKEFCFEKINLSSSDKILGSHLKFSSCDHRFLELLSKGKEYFAYPNNSTFRGLIYGKKEKGIYIYQSYDKCGRVFYRHQDRGPIVAMTSKKTVPIVICYNFSDDNIFNTRDRVDLDKKSINRILEKTVRQIDYKNAIKKILEITRPDWESGNIVLKYLSEAAEPIANWDYNEKKAKDIIFKFPDNFLAGDSYRWGRSVRIESTIKRMGFTICSEYMKYLGMTDIYHQAKKIENEEKLQSFRSPSAYEQKKYELLYDFYDELKGGRIKRKPLIVLQSKHIQGEYNESHICLNENIFNDFPKFSATFLHEISHRRGTDGSAEFTDILTLIIQLLVKSPDIIAKYKNTWDMIHQKHCDHQNQKIYQVILVPMDVQFHQRGCECGLCEAYKNKSFGVSIFNKELLLEEDNIYKNDPIYTVYANSFKNAMILARNYAKERKYEVHEYDFI